MQNHAGPLMIALQHDDLFDLNSVSTNTELPKGRAFTFIKVGIKLLDVVLPYILKFCDAFEMFAVNRLCKQ